MNDATVNKDVYLRGVWGKVEYAGGSANKSIWSYGTGAEGVAVCMLISF